MGLFLNDEDATEMMQKATVDVHGRLDVDRLASVRPLHVFLSDELPWEAMAEAEADWTWTGLLRCVLSMVCPPMSCHAHQEQIQRQIGRGCASKGE